MAAPSYTTNLAVVDTAEALGSVWDESSDAAWDDLGSPTTETDYFIQGSACISATANKTGVGTILADYGSDLGGHGTDGAYLVWQYFGAPNVMKTFANGGQRVCVGSSYGNFYAWKTGGSDYSPNPYGGWKNVAVNTSIAADYTAGTPGTTEQVVGIAVAIDTSVAKGNPFACDAIRYGRCDAVFEYGDVTNGYCTLAGFAAVNDTDTNRWGLIQAQGGGQYLQKGLVTLGTSTNAVDFRDSAAVVIIDDCQRVTTDFNQWEVNNTNSRVDWDAMTFISLGTTSPGNFVMNETADVNITGCAFNNMGTFVFLATGECSSSIFRGCDQISAGGADFDSTAIEDYEGTANSSAFIWDVTTDPQTNTPNMVFTKGTAATHAMQINSNCTTNITLSGIAFSGYNAATNQNDSTIHVKHTTGTVNITITNGGTSPSYRTDGATVNIITGTVTVKVEVKDAETLLAVETARVLMLAGSGGDLPYEEAVSLTSSSGTAYANHTGHGMETGDKVSIVGANENEYNGVFSITTSDANNYTYTITGTPDSPATGTITATFVILDGLTNSSGIVQDTSFSYTSDQPVEGRVRKGTSPVRYRTSPIAGTIGSNGLTFTSFLVPDE